VKKLISLALLLSLGLVVGCSGNTSSSQKAATKTTETTTEKAKPS
jgi:hypothetical protein